MKLNNYKLNKIYNEDCYNAIKAIPDKSIDLIMTDPPYLIESTKAGGNSNLAKSIQNMNNELSNGILTKSIDTNILTEFIRVMKKPNIYIWCNHKQIPMYLDFFVNKNKCSFDIIVWHKTNAAPLFHNKYLTDKEYCLYFRKNSYCNPSNYQNAKTVYEEPINIKDKKMFGHPTIKPLKIIKTLIENSSRRDDIILDPFIGSGTTAVACKQLDRNFLGFELEEKWFNIAEERINNTQIQLNLFDKEN